MISLHFNHFFNGGNKMPSTSDKQKRTMQAAAHNPTFAKKVGIPQKVAKDFNRADLRMSSKPQGSRKQ